MSNQPVLGNWLIFRNIITGQVFSAEIYNDLIGAYKKGQELNKIFVEERLKTEIQVGILAPIKKLQIYMQTREQGRDYKV